MRGAQRQDPPQQDNSRQESFHGTYAVCYDAQSFTPSIVQKGHPWRK